MISKNILLVGILSFSLVYADKNIFDESLEDILSTQSELKADIGSRNGARNYLDANVPVDVITYEQIQNSGLTTLTDVLRYFVAGFNSPETSIADGSDHVRAFTLRGMSPDQVLVLVNGKRVHTSSLLHINGVIGRGSSHVDLNSIALHSIERVEIMRDGAAAQYGSDAISGVINIILKGMGHKSILSGQYGQRKKGDGQKVQADAFVSIPLDYDGFFNITVEAIGEDATQRAGRDNRLNPPSVKTRVGIPESKNFKAVINTEILQNSSIEIYANAFVNYRDSKASAFYRPADLNLSNSNGFLPIINAKILDYSFSIGAKGNIDNDTTWNISNTYGINNFHFYVNNSMNYTLGSSSPSSFDNGSTSFIQNTSNLDFVKHKGSLKLAVGLEYRYEKYRIDAGDRASYTNNGILTIPAGSQGFAGFSPANEVDADRNSYALYIDSIVDLSKKLQLEILARYEEYSDFGESTNAKLALSYHLNDKILFRLSGSTGFRAPSLSQSYYSQTSSFVDSSTGKLSTQGTFQINHPLAQELGAKALKSERSKNLSLGSVYQVSKNLSFMLDCFYIEVNDRIMLTNDIVTSAVQQQKYGVTAARYFTNTAQTKTDGIDLRADYHYIIDSVSILDFDFWFNYTENKIVDSKTNVVDTYIERVRVTDGQPKDSLRFLTNYEYNRLNTALNISRFGKYSQAIGDKKYTFNPAYTVDLDMAYKITKDIKIALGGINIFDVKPNKWKGLSGDFYGHDGIKQYSRYSPFGYSGAYYYLRATMEF